MSAFFTFHHHYHHRRRHNHHNHYNHPLCQLSLSCSPLNIVSNYPQTICQPTTSDRQVSCCRLSEILGDQVEGAVAVSGGLGETVMLDDMDEMWDEMWDELEMN